MSSKEMGAKEMNVEEAVRRFIAKERLFDDCDDLHLVALSGGADSVALLLVLKSLGYRLEAVHCNFQLRGDESLRDEQFVRSLCERENIPLHLIHFDTVTYASVHQVSIEMAARELRYRFFEQLRQDIGAVSVCVAHHQDDAVETLLMNLVRCTGIHGLTGIRPRNGYVVRPLLAVSRAEIIQYLDAIGQDYVTDSTNLVPDVVRNKLRLEVLPLLREINPAASDNIARSARYMAEAERVYDKAMESSVAEVFNNGVIDVERLLQTPSPECLLHELLMPLGFTSAQVLQVLDGLSGPSGRVFTSATHELLVDRGRLIVQKLSDAPLPAMTIPETGTYCYGEDWKFRFCMSDVVEVSRQPDVATLDADKVSFPLILRPIREGDRFQPFGMTGSRLVSDYLTDRKRTLFDKRRQLVITDCDDTILWLVGERTDNRFAVDGNTHRVLTITMEKCN